MTVRNRILRYFSSLSIIKQFLILCSVSILAFAVVTGWILSTYIAHAFLERERTVTEAFVRDTVSGIAVEKSITIKEVIHHPEFIKDVIKASKQLTEVVRVKIFDSKGTIIWSDAPELIGKTFALDRDIQKAIAGETLVEIEEIWESPEHRYEMAFNRLVTVYIPVFERGGKVAGVIELYKEPHLFLKYIKGVKYAVWGTTLIGSPILYFLMFMIFKKASATIIRQNIDLRKANEEITTMQDALIEKERLAVIGEMAGAVAHNLKNPIANIRASAQLASEDLSDQGSTAETLNGIIKEVDRVDLRIKELLNFERIDSGGSIEMIDSWLLLKEVSESLSQKASVREVKIQVSQPAGRIIINTVRHSLEYALSYIIDNALDASKNGSRVEVSLEHMGDSAIITVKDYGSGIKDLQAAFRPFYTTKAKGSGLGLPLAKKFITAIGGSINVRSLEGKGTEVVITVPLTQRSVA
ncbi:MAG: HAMP domain-containing histidine kinase [Nitrospirae bacterium]|nr:HAMP domain-containing histidine kinase [Nitrospirota bacterium]